MGSRYGGLKQVDPVGPSGETVLDYAVFDARRAGFGKVVNAEFAPGEVTFVDEAGKRVTVPVKHEFLGGQAL